MSIYPNLISDFLDISTETMLADGAVLALCGRVAGYAVYSKSVSALRLLKLKLKRS